MWANPQDRKALVSVLNLELIAAVPCCLLGRDERGTEPRLLQKNLHLMNRTVG